MAYLYFPDDGPESEDYISNYFTFDSSDSRLMEALKILISGADRNDPEVRRRIQFLCKEQPFRCTRS